MQAHAPRRRTDCTLSACAGATGATGPCGAFTCVNSTNLLCYTTAANGTTGANNLCADPSTGYCVNETSALRARDWQARCGLVVLHVGAGLPQQGVKGQTSLCTDMLGVNLVGRSCMQSIRQEAGRLAPPSSLIPLHSTISFAIAVGLQQHGRASEQPAGLRVWQIPYRLTCSTVRQR